MHQEKLKLQTKFPNIGLLSCLAHALIDFNSITLDKILSTSQEDFHAPGELKL